ncbi:MAG: hypothetical protein HY688_01180 [Chloroflexi bacterium]|nr:hypothetical protein [Chloroflexota bacterium]
MMRSRDNSIVARFVMLSYGIVFAVTAVLVVLMHLRPAPALNIFRIPTYLGEVQATVWRTHLESYEVYHIILGALFSVAMCNMMGLRYRHAVKWRQAAQLSSLVGLGVVSLVFAFFLRNAVAFRGAPSRREEFDTSLIYAVASIALVVIGIATLAVLQSRSGRSMDGDR